MALVENLFGETTLFLFWLQRVGSRMVLYYKCWWVSQLVKKWRNFRSSQKLSVSLLSYPTHFSGEPLNETFSFVDVFAEDVEISCNRKWKCYRAAACGAKKAHSVRSTRPPQGCGCWRNGFVLFLLGRCPHFLLYFIYWNRLCHLNSF